TASGSLAVDGLGSPLPLAEDIVDGKIVRLGAGWHVREGSSERGFWRWAMDRAVIHVDVPADPAVAPAVLGIEVQSNPHAASSWVDLDLADESGTVLARYRASRRRTWRLPLEKRGGRRTFELRVAGASEGDRRALAIFERRGDLHYQV